MIQVNDYIGDYVNAELKHKMWHKQYSVFKLPIRQVMSSGINHRTYWIIRNIINEASKR